MGGIQDVTGSLTVMKRAFNTEQRKQGFYATFAALFGLFWPLRLQNLYKWEWGIVSVSKLIFLNR